MVAATLMFDMKSLRSKQGQMRIFWQPCIKHDDKENCSCDAGKWKTRYTVIGTWNAPKLHSPLKNSKKRKILFSSFLNTNILSLLNANYKCSLFFLKLNFTLPVKFHNVIPFSNFNFCLFMLFWLICLFML